MIEPDFNEVEALENLVGVSRETMDRLRKIVETLAVWQPKTNLVASKSLPEIWTRHVLDSAQLVTLQPKAKNWVDLGSGGGFPALVIAAILYDLPGFHITLIESNHKKTAFLRQAANAAGLQSVVSILSQRIENAIENIDPPDVLTARALAPLNDLFNWSQTLWQQKPEMIALFQKGREYRSEVQDCTAHWDFNLLEHKSVLETDSRILQVDHLCRVE